MLKDASMMRKESGTRGHVESDESIVTRVMHGEIAAFQFIVSRYEHKISLYLRHVVGNHDEVEDLLQNVFVKAYQHLGSFEHSRVFSSWIYRIAHNEAANWMRHRSRRPSAVAWEDTMVTQVDRQTIVEFDEAYWIRCELHDMVQVALGCLQKEHREMLIFRYYLDKSYREISDMTGIPINTVASRVNRAKIKLLKALGEKSRDA